MIVDEHNLLGQCAQQGSLAFLQVAVHLQWELDAFSCMMDGVVWTALL
jgi:hypothetical protein